MALSCLLKVFGDLPRDLLLQSGDDVGILQKLRLGLA
jgi:hypothetical protein